MFKIHIFSIKIWILFIKKIFVIFKNIIHVIKYINLEYNYLSYLYKVKICKLILKNLFMLQYFKKYFRNLSRNYWIRFIISEKCNEKKFNILKLTLYKKFFNIKNFLHEIVVKLSLLHKKRLNYRNKYKYLWNDLLYNLYCNVPSKILYTLVKSLNKFVFPYYQYRLRHDIDWRKKFLSKYYFISQRKFYTSIERGNYYITKIMKKFKKYVFISKRCVSTIIKHTFKFRKACRRIKSLMSDDSMFWSLTPWERTRFSYWSDDLKPYIYPQKIAVFDFNRIEYSEYLAERDSEFLKYVYNNYLWRRYLFMKEETKTFNNRVSCLIQCFDKTSPFIDSLWMYFKPWVRKIKNKLGRRRYFYRNNCNLIYKKFPSRESKIIKRSFLYRNNKITCTHSNRLFHSWNEYKIKFPDVPVLQYSIIYLKRFRKLKCFKRLKKFFYSSKFEYYKFMYRLKLLGRNFYLKPNIFITPKNIRFKTIQKILFSIKFWKKFNLNEKNIQLCKIIKFLSCGENSFFIQLKKLIFNSEVNFLKSYNIIKNQWRSNIGTGSLRLNLNTLLELQKFLKDVYNFVPWFNFEKLFTKFYSFHKQFIIWNRNLKFIKLCKFLGFGNKYIEYVSDNIIFNIFNKFYFLHKYFCIINSFREKNSVRIFNKNYVMYERLRIFELSEIINIPKYNKYDIGKKFLRRVKVHIKIFTKRLYYNLLLWVLYYFTCVYTYQKWIFDIEWIILLSTFRDNLSIVTRFNIPLIYCVNIISSYKYWDQFSKFINSSWYWYNSLDKTFSKSELYKYRSKFIKQRRFSKRMYCNLIRLNVPQNIVMGIICL